MSSTAPIPEIEFEKEIEESRLTIISEGAFLKGECTFESTTRIHGRIEGQVRGVDGTILIFTDSSSVIGTIEADVVLVDGQIDGEIRGRKKVILTSRARVKGQIASPSLRIDFGASFDGDISQSK